MKGFLILTILVSAINSYAQRPDDHMFKSIYKIAVPTTDGDKIGTGFLSVYKANIYFITAKHLFPGYSNGDSCTVGLIENKTLHSKRMRVFFDAGVASSDIAVLTGNFDGIDMPLYNLESTTDAKIGETIIFFGYPSTNIVSNNFPINTVSKGKPMPLVKKGILAGFDDSNPFNTIAIFDAQSAPGFSGSPVFVYNEDEKAYFLLAVMSGGYLSNTQVSNGKSTVELNDIFYLTSLSSGSTIGYAVQIIKELILKKK